MKTAKRNTIKALGLTALAGGMLFAAQSFATPVAVQSFATPVGNCPTAPATGIQAQADALCVAPPGVENQGTALGTVFGPGRSQVGATFAGTDVHRAQHTRDSSPQVGATGGSAYQGGNSTWFEPQGNYWGGEVLSDAYLLTWDDTPYDHSVLDYNDFMVMPQALHSVPEPAVLGMFGLGLLVMGGFVALRRRECRDSA